MDKKLQEILNFFKYQNRLKTVLRNNWTSDNRKESSAEHSWSVAMMSWMLSGEIERELGVKLNQLKLIKMALVHDIVEIEAGDVPAWEEKARSEIKLPEREALEKILANYQLSQIREIHELWIEHEQLITIESKLVKACDQLCPLIYRLVFQNSYEGTNVTIDKLNSIFLPIVSFSRTTDSLYRSLATELEKQKLLVVINKKVT